MGKLVGMVALCCVGVLVAVAVLVTAVVGGATSQSDSAAPQSPPAGDAGPSLPPGWAAMEQAAAATCPGLSWSVIAAIGTVESDNGRSTAPGVATGANSAGAEGPFQFEPATFATYGTIGPGGMRPPSPYDPVDAAYSAAAMLCADGGGTEAGLRDAVFAYNHDSTYVDTVLVLSLAFADEADVDTTVVAAIGYAAGRLGIPYLWGGTGVGGFDCSGLSQAAYSAAGIHLPRVAQDQFAIGPPVDGGTVRPGDLVFFGNGPSGVDHVGIYVGDGLMVDAPHTGADVRIEPADWTGLVGATRPR